MKIATDILKAYKAVHGWVGIICGLMLFIAFFAGAVTMFEAPLQQWASPPGRLSPPPSLERTPELLARVAVTHPEAMAAYDVNLVIDPQHPARVSWRSGDPEEIEHGGGVAHYASLTPDGRLQVEMRGPSPVAQFIDDLHRKVGLPFGPAIATPIMGGVALLYFVALVSGIIVLLPSLVRDLFALRFGLNVKRMWLDVHNLLGVFSLPLHVVMALTAIVFAFHDQFYMAQGLAFGGRRPPMSVHAPRHASPSPAPPATLVGRLRAEVPEFMPYTLSYTTVPGGRTVVRALGGDPDYPVRTPIYGVVTMDPASAKVLSVDYMPGRQDGWSTAVTSFFALHYGSFGGWPIRWSYFLLGLSGAFLFYTGNLLWIESRRCRERRDGAVQQTRATRLLGALTVGVSLGCVAGIAVTLAAARWLGDAATIETHGRIYYAVFLLWTGWALHRGAARAGCELAFATGLAVLTIPTASLVTMILRSAPPALMLVDGIATTLAVILFTASRTARKRARTGVRDSIWSSPVTND